MKPHGSKTAKGHGVSLERFSKVKTANFDKEKLLKKKKVQQYKRAKQYKKVKEKLLSEGKLPAPTSTSTLPAYSEQDGDGAAGHIERPLSPQAVTTEQAPGDVTQHAPKRRKKVKKPSAIQVLAEKHAKEQEEDRQQKEEARKAAEERKAQLQAAEKRRKKQTVKLFKKTKKGQPIMKYRVEKMLRSITGS